jgi:putative flippase GtrA
MRSLQFLLDDPADSALGCGRIGAAISGGATLTVPMDLHRRFVAIAMTKLFRQFSSFAGVGLIATGVHYATLIGVVEFARMAPPPAALTGSILGAVVSYALNRRHTFRSDLPHRRAGARFALVALVAAALTYLFMTFFVNVAGAPYLPAQAATTGIVMFWTFLAHRMWTFA